MRKVETLTNCKPGRIYPFRMKKKMRYTSPTSKHKREGFPTLHCDREENKEFTMVRAKGGGTQRDYDWKRHFSPA